MSAEKITIRISNTGLSHSGCILDFHRTVVEGYKSPNNPAAIYGIALHKFVDTMFKTSGHWAQSFMAMKNAFNVEKEQPEKRKLYLMDEKHLMHSATLLWDYVEADSNYELLELDGKPCSEQNFSIKYYEDDHIIVLLEGTLDNIGQIVNGCYAVRDWKTTSSWDVQKYLKSYELSRQLKFYRLALKLIAQREPESVLGKIGATRVGTFVTAIFLKTNSSDIEVKSTEVFQYSEKDMNDFQMMLDDYIKKVSFHISTGYLPKEGIITGACQRPWGFCNFWNVCKCPEDIGEILLKRDFKKVPFTPLNYSGEVE